MADIPGIPSRKPKPRKARRRKTTSVAWIQSGPLTPWMLMYLQWLASEPTGQLSQKGGPRGRVSPNSGAVNVAQKTAKANFLAKQRISADTLRLLEFRADAIAYFERCRSDLAFRAKEALGQDVLPAIEARREGLRAARGIRDTPDGPVTDPEKIDHRAVKGYTEWVTDVAFPKKAPEGSASPTVVIHIGNPQTRHLIAKALEDEDIQDVEVEVLEVKQLGPGDEE